MARPSSSRPRRLTVGELARRSGVGVETIRFYESEGLVARPERPPRGIRSYPPQAIKRLSFIHEAKEMGFTLREIRDLIALREDPRADAAAVRGRAMAKLREVRARAARYERMSAVLADLLARCPGQGEIAACPIIAAFAQPQAGETMSEKGRRNANMKIADLSVEGMHCEGCAGTVQALLQAEPGVKSATVSYGKGRARVAFDPAVVELSALAKAVERAGYRVSPAADAAG